MHPECRPEVIDLADQVFSTSGMVRHVCESGGDTFIIGTEVGILYPIQKRCPGKGCVPLSAKAICTNMKKTTPEKVLMALETMDPRITVPGGVARDARAAIERMLALP